MGNADGVPRKSPWTGEVPCPGSQGLGVPEGSLQPQPGEVTFPLVGFPASQGQELNFWRVEEVEQVSHTPLWAGNKELIKNQ